MGPYLYWKTAPQGPNRESDKKLGDRKDSKYMPFVVLLFQMSSKGWLAIAKLEPLSLFISLLLMLKKALDNGKMVK